MYIPTGKELIDPFKVLQEAGIRSGMAVADFGCGTLGHYVFPAAQLVGPTGKVYAIDILKSVLDGIESRMKLEGATNVITVWGDLERMHGIKLDDGILDIGLIINNLFLSKQQQLMIDESCRMVKHGGRVVFVDWKTTGTPLGPDPATRVSMEAAKQLALNAGLTIDKDFTPGPYHYGFLCTKP